MPKKTDNLSFVHAFRKSAPYINAHRGRTNDARLQSIPIVAVTSCAMAGTEPAP